MVQIDIDIPKSCAMCPLLVPTTPDVAYCKLTGNIADVESFDEMRLKDCPMREVNDETN